MTRSVPQYTFLLAYVLLFALRVAGEQDIFGGPPPEMRSHVDAFVKALNSGSSNQWERMAQEHFSPAQLRRRSVEERKQTFENLRSHLSRAGRTPRSGRPLQLYAEGSTGMRGVMELELERDAPYRIDGFRVQVGGPADGEPQLSMAPPPVNGDMMGDQLTGALDTYFAKLAADEVFSGNVLLPMTMPGVRNSCALPSFAPCLK